MNNCNRCGRMIKTWDEYVTTDDANDDDTYHIKCAGLLVIELRTEIDKLKTLMQEAADNCPTCRGETTLQRKCARCQTFLEAIR